MNHNTKYISSCSYWAHQLCGVITHLALNIYHATVKYLHDSSHDWWASTTILCHHCSLSSVVGILYLKSTFICLPTHDCSNENVESLSQYSMLMEPVGKFHLPDLPLPRLLQPPEKRKGFQIFSIEIGINMITWKLARKGLLIGWPWSIFKMWTTCISHSLCAKNISFLK